MQNFRNIKNSTANDIDEIFRLYAIATDFQKSKFRVHWPEFKRELIEMEITEERQWKMIIDGCIACIWATTFSDPQIWGERVAILPSISTVSLLILILEGMIS